jgi:hypothetical protein
VALKDARLDDLLVGLPKIVLGVSLAEAHPAEYAFLRAMQDDRVPRGGASRCLLVRYRGGSARRGMGSYDDILFDRWRGK